MDGERWFLDSPADKAMIDVYQFSGDLQYELTYLATVYEEARQVLGITDSFQGRTDPTATSGKAKGVFRRTGGGALGEQADHEAGGIRPAVRADVQVLAGVLGRAPAHQLQGQRGNTVFEEISRYDFLKQDEDGQFYWDDQFLFSCDTSAPLASNRGGHVAGDSDEPADRGIRRSQQHGDADPVLEQDGGAALPGAGSTKKYLEERLRREQQQAAQAQQIQLRYWPCRPSSEGGGTPIHSQPRQSDADG